MFFLLMDYKRNKKYAMKQVSYKGHLKRTALAPMGAEILFMQ